MAECSAGEALDFFCRAAQPYTFEMARTKNDFACFNGDRLGLNEVARPDWFALVYWPMVLGLYLDSCAHTPSRA